MNILARHPLFGVIRCVLPKHTGGNGAAYISTDPSLVVETILETVADRWAIAEHFHDVREVWGAGEQQARNLGSNIGCWNLCGWLCALVELACWDEPTAALTERADRPWDNPAWRPSHADRRRTIVREMLREDLMNHLPANTAPTKTERIGYGSCTWPPDLRRTENARRKCRARLYRMKMNIY